MLAPALLLALCTIAWGVFVFLMLMLFGIVSVTIVRPGQTNWGGAYENTKEKNSN